MAPSPFRALLAALLLPALASPPAAADLDRFRKDLGRAASQLGKDQSIRGGRCARAVYADAVDAAWRAAQARTPGEAREEVTRLQSGEEIAGHLGVTLFNAVRSQGYELDGGVYCHVEKGEGRLPEKWIGASASDGTAFILDLAAGEKGGKRMFGLRAERGGAAAAGPFVGMSVDEMFACGPWQPHPWGMAGKLFEALDRDQFKPWEQVPRCSKAQAEKDAKAAASEVPAAPGEYDPAEGRRIAQVASSNLPGTTGWCYAGVLKSLERAGLIKHPDDYDIAKPGGIPYNPAYRFAKWANQDPSRLRRQLGMRRIPAPRDPRDIPAGSVVVYQPGTCGFHWRAGHIEIAVGGGRGCSDHCQPFQPRGCFDNDAWRQGIDVYAPVQ